VKHFSTRGVEQTMWERAVFTRRIKYSLFLLKNFNDHYRKTTHISREHGLKICA
jgi:hypothetical protein